MCQPVDIKFFTEKSLLSILTIMEAYEKPKNENDGVTANTISYSIFFTSYSTFPNQHKTLMSKLYPG